MVYHQSFIVFVCFLDFCLEFPQLASCACFAMPGRALFYFFVGTLNMFMMPGDLKQHEFPAGVAFCSDVRRAQGISDAKVLCFLF